MTVFIVVMATVWLRVWQYGMRTIALGVSQSVMYKRSKLVQNNKKAHSDYVLKIISGSRNVVYICQMK